MVGSRRRDGVSALVDCDMSSLLGCRVSQPNETNQKSRETIPNGVPRRSLLTSGVIPGTTPPRGKGSLHNRAYSEDNGELFRSRACCPTPENRSPESGVTPKAITCHLFRPCHHSCFPATPNPECHQPQCSSPTSRQSGHRGSCQRGLRVFPEETAFASEGSTTNSGQPCDGCQTCWAKSQPIASSHANDDR